MPARIARRDVLKAAGAAGALLLAGSARSLGAHAPMAQFGTSRVSRLFPDDGTFLVHTDLHNHSLLSDGSGDPSGFYPQMRDAGLDVAALTDHAIQGKDNGETLCHSGQCSYAFGIHDEKWQEIGAYADAADEPGAFTAIRGFEWTTGHLGHINVWLTQNWTDPKETESLMSPRGLTGYLSDYAPAQLPIRDVHEATYGIPEPLASIDGFYEWLRTPVDEGGGMDGLAGFNHPRSYDFDRFALFPEAIDRLVSCEIFTMTTDFLFVGRDEDRPSPINACLNAGWRVGLIGVSDEHGQNWGLAGKGRGGMYVTELSRNGVHEALRSRRVFATKHAGLRIDASANGVRMGSPIAPGPVSFALDIDRGSEWFGKPLSVQVLRPGTDEPTLLHTEDIVVPAATEPVVELSAPTLDRDDGDWVFLRISDPKTPIESRAPEAWQGLGAAVAYTSPWFLTA